MVAFIDDMKEAYEWADIVLCRAGALTVSELAAAGMASILVPFPYAVDDHQYYNAQFLHRAGAAMLVREQELSAESLQTIIDELSADRERVVQMANQAYRLAFRDAGQQVAAGVLQEAIA